MLIVVRYPDPDMYRNSIAFTAISSFFLIFYLAMGRGWHRDLLRFLSFDRSLGQKISVIEPGNRMIIVELLVAAICVYVHLQLNDRVNIWHSNLLFGGIVFFYYVQWILIIFSIDVILRQLICLVRIVDRISLYVIPSNRFKARMRSEKAQELNSINAALSGNSKALESSLLMGEDQPSKLDLLIYRDRITAIKEWPFTDRIRALVLFGILPPLTWVIAALIEILIEGAI